MGPQGFVRFNDLLLGLTGATGRTRTEKLRRIARSRLLTIAYDKATRPPLVPVG